jgi:hypothetical protein
MINKESNITLKIERKIGVSVIFNYMEMDDAN